MRWLLLFLAWSALGQDSQRTAIEKQRAAVTVQRESVRKQQESLRLDPLIATTAVPECEPIAEPVLTPLIDESAKKTKLEKELIRAVIRQESQFYPCAVSEKGARGLMQLMPETAGQFQVKDPFDPKESIAAGAKYLKQLLDKYGKLDLALSAYNAGPAAVDAAKGIPDIPETRDYVRRIFESLGMKLDSGAVGKADVASSPGP